METDIRSSCHTDAQQFRVASPSVLNTCQTLGRIVSYTQRRSSVFVAYRHGRSNRRCHVYPSKLRDVSPCLPCEALSWEVSGTNGLGLGAARATARRPTTTCSIKDHGTPTGNQKNPNRRPAASRKVRTKEKQFPTLEQTNSDTETNQANIGSRISVRTTAPAWVRCVARLDLATTRRLHLPYPACLPACLPPADGPRPIPSW